jgi:hypothetical protein
MDASLEQGILSRIALVQIMNALYLGFTEAAYLPSLFLIDNVTNDE